MPRREGRVLLLATEPATRFRLDHAHRVRWTEETLDRLERIERTLYRAVDRDAASLRHRDHPVGLDVDVLLVAGAVCPLDDDVGEREAGRQVTLADVDLLEDARRSLGIQG